MFADYKLIIMHFCVFSKDEINSTNYRSLHNLEKDTRNGTDMSPSLCVHFVHIVKLPLEMTVGTLQHQIHWRRFIHSKSQKK
jgi:hypothetical protein